MKNWQETVSSLCVGNNQLTFCLSVSFAAPLLNLLGFEGGGFHLRGISSKGKTTALKTAASVWSNKDYIQRWRATTNGIEAMAAGHNDCLLCLDEISQVNPYDAGEISYMLANGTGKARADRYGHSRKKIIWRLFFLSTGEISLTDHMSEVGRKARAGQEVRIVDIPADTNKHGLFECLHGYAEGSSFADALSDFCKIYYGTAGREFLKSLIENKESISLVKKFIDEFVSSVVPQNADGQVFRVARRFGVVAAGGELATVFGITGWEKGGAMKASRACFLDWLNARGGIESQEEQAVISQVRSFFQQHGESRFTPWDAPDDHKTINRVGYRKIKDGELEFYVFPEAFKTEIAKGFDRKYVNNICLKYGLLKPGSNGEASRSEQLPNRGKKIRCYRFTSKVLGEEDVNES